MGIREFLSIIKFGNLANKLCYTEHPYESPCNFDVIIIDTVSYFYGNLVTLKLGPGEELDFEVYRDLARQCFDRMVQSMPGGSFFKCKEIFISFDIGAPATKRRTQAQRRQRGCYIETTERMKFYRAIVMEFIENAGQCCDHDIEISFPVSFEGYKSKLEYTAGEGEYIGMNYIRHSYYEKSHRSFAVFGNDNDILMMASIFNTCMPGIDVQYVSPTLSRNEDDCRPSRKHLKCHNLIDSFAFMCNTFLVGNDFVPMVISGTKNQIKRMFDDDSSRSNDCVVKLARRAFDMYNNESMYSDASQVVDDFAEYICALLKHYVDGGRGNGGLVSGSSAARADATSGDYDYHNLDIFVKRFVWNVCYFANLLYSSAGRGMYDGFESVFPSHSPIGVNSPVFIDDVKDNVLRFLIEACIGNGTLRINVERALKSVFTPHAEYRLECDGGSCGNNNDISCFVRGTSKSAGVDVIIHDEIPVISPGSDYVLPLKCIPHCLWDNFYVIERSSAFVRGIMCTIGRRDDGCRPPCVEITNKSDADVKIAPGSRIFQIIFRPYNHRERGLHMNAEAMRGPVELEYSSSDGTFAFNYTGADIVYEAGKPLHVVDTLCFITPDGIDHVHAYVKIVPEKTMDGVTIHCGVIDADYTDSVKLLCRIGPGGKISSGDRLCTFRAHEYIPVECKTTTQMRTGGIGSTGDK